jgi:hypothetical protein
MGDAAGTAVHASKLFAAIEMKGVPADYQVNWKKKVEQSAK